MATLASETPGKAATVFRAWLCISTLARADCVVNSSVNATLPPSTVRPFTRPRLTTSVPVSGSLTVRSAESTDSSVTPPAPLPPKRLMVSSLYGRGRGRSILAGLLLALSLATPAAAEGPRLGAGIKEFAAAGGFSSSHNLSGTATGITAMHILPHYGWFVTDPGGPRWVPGWLYGSLELIAEPTYLKINRSESTNFAG